MVRVDGTEYGNIWNMESTGRKHELIENEISDGWGGKVYRLFRHHGISDENHEMRSVGQQQSRSCTDIASTERLPHFTRSLLPISPQHAPSPHFPFIPEHARPVQPHPRQQIKKFSSRHRIIRKTQKKTPAIPPVSLFIPYLSPASPRQGAAGLEASPSTTDRGEINHSTTVSGAVSTSNFGREDFATRTRSFRPTNSINARRPPSPSRGVASRRIRV